MRRPPSRTHGILPDVRQLNSVRRLIGNRASNCFWLIKPAPPAGVWFCSARMPVSRISALAGDTTLKKSFRSPFIHRKLCAKQRPGGCVTHAGFQKHLTRCRNGKCPRNLSTCIHEPGKTSHKIIPPPPLPNEGRDGVRI